MNQIGPYTVIERIASGGMGEIYVAKLQREAGFEKLVAVKRILPHLAHDEAFVRMFEAEARLSALLTHRNIVQVYDFGRSGNETYLAMEFVDGFNVRTLQDMGRKRNMPIPMPMAIRIAASVARALDYAFRREGADGKPLHIIHRDVSPQNILVSVEGEVKVADFGLAKALQIDATSLSGELKGKLNYMSPEQVRGQPLGSSADIFSLGAVLYELLTGKRLYPRNVAIRTLIGMVERAEFRSLRQVDKSVPIPIVEVVERCLRPDPKERFESTRALVQVLDGVISELGIAEPTYTLADYVRRFDADRPLARILTREETMVPNRPIVRRQDDEDRTPAAEEGALDFTPTPKTQRAMLRPQQHGPRTAISRVATQSMVQPRVGKKSFLPLLAVVLVLVVSALAWVQYKNSSNELPANTAVSPQTPVDTTTPPVKAPVVVKEPEKPVVSERQTLRIDGVPEGAECEVLDKLRDVKLPGQSCGDDWNVGPGLHRILVSAEGYIDWEDEVRVLPGAVSKVTAKMKHKPVEPCSLRVSTEPPGAHIRLDGVLQNGATPIQLKGLAPGAHTLGAELRGHGKVEKTVTCDRALGDLLKIQLKPLLFRVEIGGVPHELRLGREWHKKVRVRGIDAQFRVVTRKNFLKVTVNAKPFANVGVGKRDLGVVPVQFRVPVGQSRRVRLSRAGKLVGTVLVRVSDLSVTSPPLP